jgi:hypothetical protein
MGKTSSEVTVELTDDMKRVVLEQRLGFVATVTADGKPNVSPKGTTSVFDDEHLMFADLASPGTIKNLESNPYVEVNVVDPIVRKGYRFRGTATTYTSGDRFDRGVDALSRHGYTVDPSWIRSIVVIAVDDAASLISPGYRDGVTEESMSEEWLGRHTALHDGRAGARTRREADA